MSGRRSSTLSGMPTGTDSGNSGSAGAARLFCGRIASDQQFQRTQCLLVGEAGLTHTILEVAEVGAGQRRIQVAAVADALAIFGEPRQFTDACTMSCAAASCSLVSVARNQLRATCAAIDWRANS